MSTLASTTDSGAPTKLLRVSSSTDSNSLASAITATYAKDAQTEMTLRTIGAASLNQAVKAAIISNKVFSKQGKYVTLVPCFNDLNDEKGTTSIEMKVVVQKF